MMMNNNDYGTQLKNIGIQLKNIGTQILNDGMLNQSIFNAQIQNMGTEISNMGVQIFNYGTQIINIMNNINMCNMNNLMNQMAINMMKIMENVNNNINNNNNNFEEKKLDIVNVIFNYREKKTNIQTSYEAIMDEVLNKYIEIEFEGQNKKNYFFLFNGLNLGGDNYKNKKIKDLFPDGSIITVVEKH